MHLPTVIYSVVRRLVPIACVDALPYRRTESGLEIGLIQRLDASERTKVWNLVGGRVRYREPLADALDRHLREALGDSARWRLPDVGRPIIVAEYFPSRGERDQSVRVDPRKHAIALAYAVEVEGDIDAGGEALAFRWFAPESLPSPGQIGFDQLDVIEALCVALGGGTVTSRDMP